jgi:flagellar protein FliS
MAVQTGYDTYRSSHYEGMEPKRLILMLYDGALKHIHLAKEGVLEKDIKKRGEHLGKTIAIVSELNASLDPGYKDEAIEFLRGLYAAILAELPKVSISNDISILDRSASYLSTLKEIWVNTVMGKAEKKEGAGEKMTRDIEPSPANRNPAPQPKPPGVKDYAEMAQMGIKSFSV